MDLRPFEWETEQLEAPNREEASELARYTVEEVLAIAEERDHGPETN